MERQRGRGTAQLTRFLIIALTCALGAAGAALAQFTPVPSLLSGGKPKPVVLNAVVFYSPNSGPFFEYTDASAPPVTTWVNNTSCSYTNQPTNYRNPYVYTDQRGYAVKYNGFYWMASNNATFTNTQTSFSLARSADACNWTWVQEVSTNINVTNQLTYNASFYQDDAGLMHVIAAAGTQSPYHMLIYEWHPLTADPAGAWSAAHLVNYAASPNPAIDPFAVKNVDDGTWRIFYKNDTSPFCMEEAISSGPPDSGTYTLLHNGDWAGWGCGKESPYVTKLNSLWYMFMFDFNNVPQPGHTVYSTAANLNGASWSAKATAGIAELGGLGTDAGGMFIGPTLPNQGGGLTPPSQATAAGFTTLAANFDFVNNQMCVYDGRSPACVAASPTSNWLDCVGNDTTKIWHRGFPGSTVTAACNHSIVNDPSTGQSVLQHQFLASYGTNPGFLGNSDSVSIQTVTNGGASNGGTLTFGYPQGFYVEGVYRASISTVTPASAQYQTSTWEWSTGSCVVDYQLAEIFSTNGGGYGSGTSGGWCPGGAWGDFWHSYSPDPDLPPGYNITQYHKYGMLRTHDGSTSMPFCTWVDDVFQHSQNQWGGCIPSELQTDNTIYSNRNWSIMWIASSDSSYGGQPRPNEDINAYVQYLRVWSCANWATQDCHGSTEVNNGQGLLYWH